MHFGLGVEARQHTKRSTEQYAVLRMVLTARPAAALPRATQYRNTTRALCRESVMPSQQLPALLSIGHISRKKGKKSVMGGQ